MMTSKFYVMWKDKRVAEIKVDYKNEIVKLTNFDDDPLHLPFGVLTNPTYKDFEDYLEDRCFPRTRYDCKDLLNFLGVQHYEPYSIVKKTHGIQWEDFMWLTWDGDNTKYEDIKAR